MYQASDGAYVVVLPRGTRGQGLDGLEVLDKPVRWENASVSVADLANIQSVLGSSGWSPGARTITYGFGYVAGEDQVVIHSDAPADEFAGVLAEFPGLVRYEHVEDMSRASRFTSNPPHLGGAALEGTLVSGSYGRCTTGFTVNKGGALYMMTAGHCFASGARPISPGSGLVIGQVAFRASFPQRDMELLGGSNYSSSIYVGTTGTPIQVASAGDPISSYNNYCYSGSVTYEACGKSVYQSTATFCSNGQCTFNLVSMTGGAMPSGGDSGAPIYTKSSVVGIRGMLIARNSQIMYLEKWSMISSTFGVSIWAP
jgi:hypothetical protein